MQSSASVTTGARGTAAAPSPGRRVVDAPTRVFHWLFAATFAGAWLTADSEHWRPLHATLGYTFAALLGWRVLYGLVGPRQARLGMLWRRLSAAPAWLRGLRGAVSLRAVNWRQGQHLVMSLAIVLMLAGVLPLVASGHGNFQDWGDWLEEVHEFFGNAFLGVVLVHTGLLAALSVLRRQNQALPMLTGRLPGPGPGPVQHDRGALAIALLLGTAGFAAWVWQALAPAALP